MNTTALLILAILLIAFGHSQINAQENGDSVILAASKCDTSTVKTWIASGSKVNTTDEHGNTILMYAVEVNCTELVDYLLSLGANVNAKVKHGGGTPLMTASFKGHVALVRKLLVAGADVNAKDQAGWTALKNAVVYQQNDVIKVLIEAGADISTQDNNGEPLLITAATVNNIDMVKLLLASGAEVDAKNKEGWTL